MNEKDVPYKAFQEGPLWLEAATDIPDQVAEFLAAYNECTADELVKQNARERAEAKFRRWFEQIYVKHTSSEPDCHQVDRVKFSPPEP